MTDKNQIIKRDPGWGNQPGNRIRFHQNQSGSGRQKSMHRSLPEAMSGKTSW